MLQICTLSLTGPVLGMSEWCNAVILSSMTHRSSNVFNEQGGGGGAWWWCMVVYVFNMRSQGRIMSLSLYAIVASGECAIDPELRDGHGHHSRHMPSYMARKDYICI